MGPSVAIVGGGVVGSSIAAFLTAGGARVTVVERDPSYARASSSLSASSIRTQFSTPVNIALSRFGIDYLRTADVGLREPGYLFLAGEAGLATLRANLEVQRAEGADLVLLSPGEISARFPFLSMEGVAGGTLGLSGEGWFDGPGLLARFRAEARGRGAAYVHGEAVGFDMVGGRVAAVLLADGSRVAADVVVNAAGTRARFVAGWAGIALPVEARKRCIFVFQCKERFDPCPMVIDKSGVFFRPEGDRYIGGYSPTGDGERLDFEVEHSEWDEVVWPTLAGRVPAFEAVKVSGFWAGHYDMNVFDHNGLLGILPEVPNLVFANGFSGHGMMQSPGVGRGIAELILHGAYRSLDLSALDVGRVRAGRALVEANVI